MYILPPLPYPADALAPTVSADTLNTHHGKHHAKYVENLNALAKDKGLSGPLEDIVRLAKDQGEKKLFNNAAQAWNHAFFWECMAPNQTKPSAELAQAIDKAFGGLDGLRAKFVPEGVDHFASGWAWLIAKSDGSLAVISTHDADTALLADGAPLLTCDVWEHAYYIDYKNDRKSFVEAFFDKLVNWDFVSAQYAAATAGGQGYRYPPEQ
jgi:Fe-Mn family superoxide dismutase